MEPKKKSPFFSRAFLKSGYINFLWKAAKNQSLFSDAAAAAHPSEEAAGGQLRQIARQFTWF
jgi:hypothetical protein